MISTGKISGLGPGGLTVRCGSGSSSRGRVEAHFTAAINMPAVEPSPTRLWSNPNRSASEETNSIKAKLQAGAFSKRRHEFRDCCGSAGRMEQMQAVGADGCTPTGSMMWSIPVQRKNWRTFTLRTEEMHGYMVLVD